MVDPAAGVAGADSVGAVRCGRRGGADGAASLEWAGDASTGRARGRAEPAKDTLGRDTPRGMLLGFMNAGRKGTDQVATFYLNTSLRDHAAADLAHKLFVVLDSRLPPRITEVSDRREGSLANP